MPVERAPARLRRSPHGPTQAWWFAAPTVVELAGQLRDAATEQNREPRRCVAPETGPARLAIVDPDPRKADLAARIVARGRPFRGRSDIWFSPEGLADQGGRLAFVFPGVEPNFSADVGDIARHFATPAPVIDDATLGRCGASIIRLGLFLDDILSRLGVAPEVVAGHSLGEWTGTVAAGLLTGSDPQDFIGRLDLDRLEFPDVEFAMLGCGAAKAHDLLAALDDVVVSHDNCPRQSVICGPGHAVDQALDVLRDNGQLGVRLNLRSGFHTPALVPYLGSIREHLDALPLRAGRIPLWSATTVAPYPGDADAVRALHLRHLVEPVRFRELIEALYDDGVRLFVQPGVGSLPSFIAQTLGERDHLAVACVTPKHPGLAQLHRVVAALWVDGVPVRVADLPWASQTPTTQAPVSPSAGTTTKVRDAAPVPTPVPTKTPAPKPMPVPQVPLQSPSPRDVSATLVIQAAAALFAEATRATSEVLGAWDRRSVPVPSPRASRRLSLSLGELPEVIDHALYLQPAGWADVTDRFPVVPLTAQLELLADAARDGDLRPVVALSGVRAMRWLDIAEPVVVKVELDRISPDEIGVAFTGHSRATVHLADSFPAPPLRHRRHRLSNQRETRYGAEELFARRLMFHGPRYQGIVALGPIGDDGIQGQVEALAARGSLLDNVGKLVAYWVMEHRGWGESAFPIGIDRIDYFGGHPAPGTVMSATVRIEELTEDRVRATAEVMNPDATLWCRVNGWTAHIFHSDEIVAKVLRYPEHNGISEPQPEGWVLVRERWSSGAARELVARRYLSRGEREVYERQNLRAQRAWLLGRIAVKDAVRRWLADRGERMVFPVEIEVGNDDHGAPFVRSRRLDGHDLRVSLAHAEWAAAAIVAEGRAVGIDLAEVRERGPSFAAVAFSDAERSASTGSASTGSVSMGSVSMGERLGDPLAVTAAWAAKEAASKAEGTGLHGRPADFVTIVSGDGHVDVGRHRVAWRDLDPDDIISAAGHRLVAAWTVERDQSSSPSRSVLPRRVRNRHESPKECSSEPF
jgi:phosphopantetheinyl transferase (holo-ACP synthase)